MAGARANGVNGDAGTGWLADVLTGTNRGADAHCRPVLTHRGPDAGAVANPEGLGYESEQNTRDEDSNCEIVQVPGEINLTVSYEVATADENGPSDGAGHQSVVPGRSNDEYRPEGPENDDRVEEPVLVVPGLEVFRGGRAFLIHGYLWRRLGWRSLGRV